MNDTGKKLVSHGSAYLVGNILRYSVSFVMLPIYTRVLTPAEFGTIELLSMVIDFAGIIFGLRIGQAIFRFYLMAEDDFAKSRVISSALVLTTLLSGFGFLLLYGASGIISKAVFGGPEQQNLLVLFSLSLLFHPVVEVAMTYIRAQQRPWFFVSFSTLKLFLQLSLNIYLVVFLGLGVKGVVLSAVFSGGAMALLLGSYCLGKVGLHVSFSQAKTLVAFSYPLILASIVSFYVTFGDRYFLNLYGTLSDVGIYSLGYKFGFLLTFIGTQPFMSIWDSERYEVLKKPDPKATFQEVFVLFIVFILIIAVGISVFAKNVLMIMADPDFWGAAQIVPIVLLAYFFQGLMAYCNLGILVHRKTFIITKSTILSAGLITVLFFVLIPRFGAAGAAWATAATFAVRFLYVYFHAKSLYDMELPWKRIYPLLPVSALAVLIAVFGPDHIVWSICLNILVFLIFVYTLTQLPVLSVKHRLRMRSLLLHPWQLPRQMRGMVKSS
ncbi:MAG: lipopolysaccharide biosynthesis protein [Desulfosalsimonas sp.]